MFVIYQYRSGEYAGGGRRTTAGASIAGNAGKSRDPRGMCEAGDAFSGGIGSQRGRGYQHGGRGRSRSNSGGNGFSFGNMLRNALIGGLVGGLTGTAFYGMDRAVERVSRSVARRRQRRLENSRGSRFPENPNELFPENYAGLEREIKSDGKINYEVQAGNKTYKVEYHPRHIGDGHYNGNHYHVLKLGEIPKPGKTRPPYFRLPNLDPNTPAQGGTFAPGDLLPTKNKK